MAAADAALIDRATIEDFLKTSIELVMSDVTRNELKDPSSGHPGAKLVEIQARVWQNLGISVDVGRLAVNRLEQNFPDDREALVSLRKEFAKTIDTVYIQCLEDRRPSVLEKSKELPRAIVLEFLVVCNLKLDTAEVQDRMRKHIKSTGSMPNSIVNEVHDEVMELLGFDKNHGRASFENLGKQKLFEQDREMAVAVARWRGKSTSVCLKLLSEHRKEGGDLNVTEEVKAELLQMQAKEELDAMSFDDRARLLEKNAKKVNVFRNLPDEARERHLAKLTQEEKMELAKSEILMMTLVQSRQQQ